MSVNSIGGGGAKPKSAMLAFDRLPAAGRGAYRNALENWTPNRHATLWVRGVIAPKQIVADVARWDSEETIEREAARRAARGPYKGLARADTAMGGKKPIKAREASNG